MLFAFITAGSVLMVSLFIPNDKNITTILTKNIKKTGSKTETTVSPVIPYVTLLIANFIVSLSLVATFPYFMFLVRNQFHIQSSFYAGILFSIPHLSYLLFMFALQKKLLIIKHKKHLFYLSLISLAISILLQVITSNVLLFIVFRFLMGISMICVYTSLNKLISEIKMAQKEGAVFGWLDSFNKYGGVLGGLGAGILFSMYDAGSPFIFASIAILFFCILSAKCIYKPLFYLYQIITVRGGKKLWKVL